VREVKPCPYCGGKVMLVCKRMGPLTEAALEGNHNQEDFELFEAYVCCEDCDDLEESELTEEDLFMPEVENWEGALRVWWIPQVPGTPMYYPVKGVEQAKFTLRLLSEYDLFQFENNIKPDYSNAGGLEVDLKGTGDWECWYDEAERDIDELMEEDDS